MIEGLMIFSDWSRRLSLTLAYFTLLVSEWPGYTSCFRNISSRSKAIAIMRCFWNLHRCMFSLPFPLSSEGSIFHGLQLGFNQITLSSFKMTTLCSRQRDRSVWQDSPTRLSEDYQQQVITRIKILPRPEWPSYARLGTVNAISFPHLRRNHPFIICWYPGFMWNILPLNWFLL